MTLLENVLLAAQKQSGERILPNWLAPGRVAAEERRNVEKAMALLELRDARPTWRREPARILSGGQRKLLELARILMADPKIILLDEPAAGVNPTLLEVIMARIAEINRARRHAADHRAQHGPRRAALPARPGHGKRTPHVAKGRPTRWGATSGSSRRISAASRMSDRAILAVDDLVAGYEPGVPIVRGASIQVRAGEIVVILGPNGAGKSTLIKAIAGLVPKFSGRVFLAGEDITHAKPHEMVRHGLAFVPQTENVFAAMTVDDNLQLAASVLPKNARRRRIDAMLSLFPDLARQSGLARRPAVGRPAADARGRARSDGRAEAADAR